VASEKNSHRVPENTEIIIMKYRHITICIRLTLLKPKDTKPKTMTCARIYAISPQYEKP
jgi:hypothetical protein